MTEKRVKNTDDSKPLMRLVRLVKVMTSGQKRAFKRDATFWSDKQESAFYVQLFDEICKFTNKPTSGAPKNLQEVLLKKSAKRIKGVSDGVAVKSINIQDIAVRSNYLYQRILETMRFVKTRSATFKDLNGDMQDVYFLYNSDLTDDCLKLITETILLAQRIDRPSYILELCALKRRVLFAKNTNDLSEDRFQSIIAIENVAREQLLLYNQLTVLNNRVMTYQSLNVTIPENVLTEMADIVQSYETDHDINGLGVRTRFQMFILFLKYYKYLFALTGEKRYETKSKNYGEQLYNLLKSEPTFKEDEYPMYQIWVAGYLFDLLKENKFDAVEKELIAFEKDQDRLFQSKTLAYIKVQMLIGQERFTEAFDYISDIKLASTLRLFNNQIWPSRMITLCFLGAYVSVMLRAYTEAGKWTKMILQDTRYKITPTLRLPMPFIQALVQFETVPSKSEENLVDTLQKDLKKLTKVYTDENLKPLVQFSNQLKLVFMEFIKEKKLRSRLPAGVSEQLLEKASQLKAETFQNSKLEPFRIPIAWMLSHLKNSKISEEMK
jgi:hypothetical protein